MNEWMNESLFKALCAIILGPCPAIFANCWSTLLWYQTFVEPFNFFPPKYFLKPLLKPTRLSTERERATNSRAWMGTTRGVLRAPHTWTTSLLPKPAAAQAAIAHGPHTCALSALAEWKRVTYSCTQGGGPPAPRTQIWLPCWVQFRPFNGCSWCSRLVSMHKWVTKTFPAIPHNF